MKNYFVIFALFLYLFCTAQEEIEDEISQRYELSGLTIERKKTLKPGNKILLSDLNFKGGTTELLPGSETILEDLLTIMRDNPQLKIQIQGHICCIPDSLSEVSEGRARIVWLYLLLNEVENDRVTYKDFGGTRPIYSIPERNEMERRQNRRVEIEIIAN